MDWLRLHHSILHSGKIHRLSDREFRAWINMLVVASMNNPRGTLPGMEDLAFALRKRVEYTRQLIDKFILEGLVEVSKEERKTHVAVSNDTRSDNEAVSKEILYVHDWDQYQFESDDINQRVKLHRARKRNVSETLHETPSDTDTETDTDTEEIPPTPLDAETEEFAAWAEAAYKRHPKPSNRHLAFLEFKKNFAHDKPARQVFDRNHKLWIASRNWQEKGGAFVPPLCKPDGSGFIPDMAWQRPPPAEVKKSNGLEYAYRELEKANQEETNNDSKKGSSKSAITVRGSPGLPEAGGTRDRRKPAAESGLRRVGESFSQRFGQ